ncbi:MAG TPA: ABC transporter permease [Longimicrobium sp.]|jgi:predicted permease
MRWIAEARERLRGLFFRAREEAEMDEELRFHLEMETERLMREEGLGPAEARRRARVAFGGVEKYKEEVRDARGLGWLTGMSLDFKLGLRMLLKYPGLTLVGGLAMAFAIWVGAGTFEFVTQVLRPTLPLDEGGRIVGVRNWDAAAGRPHDRALHDFAAWRHELRAVGELGAFRTLERNLITGAGEAEPVEVAEISASAFRLARVPPLLGRSLVETDEQAGAPPVVVIGHDVWKTRFGGDPGVVGRTVRLGSAEATVVGVMPEGFGFPVAQGLWVPLHLSPLDYERGAGPEVRVFGRLAPGATLGEAQAELAALGRRAAADFPRTHRHLRPRVAPYAQSILSLSGTESLLVGSTNLFLVMFLVLVCGNVALLMFARAATREGEIVVRSALGASRGRIVTQLFAEALVLAGAAAAVGLAGAGAGMRWGFAVVEGALLDGARLPFWFHPSLSPATVLYAGVLAALAAAIAGVLPALKVTRGLQARLREAGAGGGGLRFGGIWTAVIVAQIAVTVVFPVTAFATWRDVEQVRSIRADFAAEEFLSARLAMDREAAPADTSRAAFAARFRAARQELERRLAAEPGVAGVTFAERLPRMYHPHRIVEVDTGGAAPRRPQWPEGYRVSSVAVDADYFQVLGAPVRAGRGFHSGDFAPDARVVVVNRSFVERVLGGRNPVGRRVRYVYLEGQARTGDEEPGPWHEIVGVVDDLGMAPDGFDPKAAGFYHPLAPDAAGPLHVAVRVRGSPESFGPRLRALAAGVDPTLRVDGLVPMDELSQTELQFLDFWFRITVLVSAIAVLLSLTGIYAVMSFTVSRRTREIGIRVALGADARRVVLAIFRRPLGQVALGVAAGALLIGALLCVASEGMMPLKAVAWLAGYAAFMLGVCLLACVVPTRRALRIEPAEALRVDG